MLKELTTTTNGMWYLQACLAEAPSASIEPGTEATEGHAPRATPYHGNRHSVEWLLLAAIWGGTLLLLSQAALGLAGMV